MTGEECKELVTGVSGAEYKGFVRREEAEQFLGIPRATSPRQESHTFKMDAHFAPNLPQSSGGISKSKRPQLNTAVFAMRSMQGGGASGGANYAFTLYFDGGSRGNPGIAGAGAVLYR
jgi:hypothetical protein